MKEQIIIWNLEDAKRLHENSEPLAGLLINFLPKDKPVYDFGCGTGYYLGELSGVGFKCKGVEGTEGIKEISHFNDILTFDLSKELNKDWKKGSVICLEVIEHLTPDQEEMIINNITKYVDKHLIISWALKGQQGYGHNNCQNADYVIDLFNKRGFKYQEDLSIKFRNIAGIEKTSWFKNTIYVFENER